MLTLSHRIIAILLELVQAPKEGAFSAEEDEEEEEDDE